MSSLQIDGQHFTDVAVGELSGQRAIGQHRLMLALNLINMNWNGKTELTLLDLTADAVVQAPSGGQLPLGRFVPQRPGVICRFRPGLPPGSASAYLVLDLQPRQVELLDAVRQGHHLNVMLDVRGMAQFGTGAIQDAWAQLHTSFSRESWLRALEASGFRETLLLEVPLANEAATGVYKHLRSAEAHFRRAEYDASVGDCRLALEALGTLTETDDKRANLRQALEKLETAQAMSLEERLMAVRYALKHVCHPSHHADTVSQSISYGREDARMVLHATAAVLAHYLEPPR